MERSVGSVVTQYREIVDFDIDGSRRGPSMQSWRDLLVPSRPNIQKNRFRYRRVDALAVSAEMERSGCSIVTEFREIVDFDINGSRRLLSMQSWRDLSVPS